MCYEGGPTKTPHRIFNRERYVPLCSDAYFQKCVEGEAYLAYFAAEHAYTDVTTTPSSARIVSSELLTIGQEASRPGTLVMRGEHIVFIRHYHEKREPEDHTGCLDIREGRVIEPGEIGEYLDIIVDVACPGPHRVRKAS